MNSTRLKRQRHIVSGGIPARQNQFCQGILWNLRVFIGIKHPILTICYENADKEKTGKPCDFSLVVDYTDKFSNFFEDLLKLDGFAQSVEDELNRNVSEEEESREDL